MKKRNKKIVSVLGLSAAFLFCFTTIGSNSDISSRVYRRSASQAQTETVEDETAEDTETDSQSFSDKLSDDYDEADIEDRTSVRWWLPEATLTDETIIEEVQAIYDAGFRGIEICQQSSAGRASIYAYDTEQWNHDLKLIMNEALDKGMTVSLTSGTNWSTTNVPGLDPDSQAAMQGVAASYVIVGAGQNIAGEITAWEDHAKDEIIKSRVAFSSVSYTDRVIGAYAYKIAEKDSQTRNQALDDMGTLEEQTTDMYRIEDGSCIDLTDKVEGSAENGYTLSWTAPNDGDYAVMFYWQAGTNQTASPSATPSYCVNYFDKAGVEAFEEYFEANVFDDPELNAKIINGDVNLFMDSLEIELNGNSTYWPENFAEEFQSRKGYDIMEYLYMVVGLPDEGELTRWAPDRTDFGGFNAETDEQGEQILNDIWDVQTELYMENYLRPMREYLSKYNIKLRAQISYGRHMEISQPIMEVDYPEMENLNQRNQVDMYRLWTGGSKLQNKVLSSETGALGMYGYCYDRQKSLQEAYSVYASGGSQINWHVWQSSWYYENEVGVKWPGYQSLSAANFNAWGTREIAYDTYSEMNQHLGRVQHLLREGNSRTDVGMVYTSYDQQVCCTMEDASQDMGMPRHDSMIFPSTELQEHGYTYDYFNPEFLTADGVYYDETSQTLELAGYKALVIWQDVLDLDSANEILDLANKGMKIVVVDGAATQTTFNDGKEDQLASVISQMESLSNVKTAASADDVYEALQELGVDAYAGFSDENYQLLSQTRGDEDGNRYLYLYNYCDGTLHDDENDPAHGTHAETDIVLDGTFIPYSIDSWSGEVTKLNEYRWEDGKTIISIELDYGDISLYAFENVASEESHVVSSIGGGTYYTDADGNQILRASESGTYETTMNDGTTYTNQLNVNDAFDIKDWYLTVSSWDSSKEKQTREDTFIDSSGNQAINYLIETEVTEIKVKLDEMTTWDNIEEVGKEVSGKGYYVSTFEWDGSASGAILDLGDDLVNGIVVYVNEQKTNDVNVNSGKVDISDQLMKGTNKIEIEYSSNYVNVLLSKGRLSVGQAGWSGYDCDYRSYGPSQAVIRPYNDVNVKTGEVYLPTLENAPEWEIDTEGFDSTGADTSDSSGSNVGLYVGIGVGCGVVVIGAGVAAFFVVRKKKKAKTAE